MNFVEMKNVNKHMFTECHQLMLQMFLRKVSFDVIILLTLMNVDRCRASICS